MHTSRLSSQGQVTVPKAIRDQLAGDVELVGYREAGLRRPCILRLKLFTLDRRLIVRTLGRESAADRQSAGDSLRRFLAV